MRRLTGLALLLLLLCGCAAGTPQRAPLAIATPGPVQSTQIQGFFRAEGEPEEVVELDAEHGHWAYRTDTLGVIIESREADVDAGTAAWLEAQIAWRDRDPLTADAVAADCVLFLPGAEAGPLIENGAIVTEDNSERLQRAGWGALPDGGYVAIALTGRYEGETVGLTAEEFAALFMEAGCDQAVQTAAGADALMLFMNAPLNDPLDGQTPSAPATGTGWRAQEGAEG